MSGKSRVRQALEAESALAAVTRSPPFVPAVCKRVTEFALLGATNEEIAAFIGVSTSTFDLWIVEKPRLRAALAKGRELGDVRVAGALHRRAVGFSAKAQKVMNIGGEAQVVEYKEYYPPDVQAQRYWLNNKRPRQWQERNGPEAGAVLDLAALVKALHANRGDDAKVIEGEAKEEPDTP